MNDNNNVRADI